MPRFPRPRVTGRTAAAVCPNDRVIESAPVWLQLWCVRGGACCGGARSPPACWFTGPPPRRVLRVRCFLYPPDAFAEGVRVRRVLSTGALTVHTRASRGSAANWPRRVPRAIRATRPPASGGRGLSASNNHAPSTPRGVTPTVPNGHLPQHPHRLPASSPRRCALLTRTHSAKRRWW